MKLTVYDIQGVAVDSIEADDAVFGLPPHHAAMRQALLAQMANRRAGSANTSSASREMSRSDRTPGNDTEIAPSGD